MQLFQYLYEPESGWQLVTGEIFEPDLILAFGSGKDCSGDILVEWWRTQFPNSQLVGCSTAGEISGTNVSSNTIVATGIKFDRTDIQVRSVDFNSSESSHEIGKKLASTLPHQGLAHCLVLSDGLNINGTQLVEGLEEVLPKDTNITGGLAGDGKRFEHTQVCFNQDFGSNKAVAIGFYGDQISIQFGSLGGWDTFGPSRLITKAEGNVLFELDGKSALSLYKEYLGEYAKDLPSSGLLFPLEITTPQGKEFVRTLLAVDEDSNSMTFAGDLPEGSYAKLMRANFDRLIDGASDAAKLSTKNEDAPELAVLISCVGRRLVLGQRVEDEIEAVNEVFQDKAVLTGFYSYGEICPLVKEDTCTLHNQTMTITTFKEA